MSKSRFELMIGDLRLVALSKQMSAYAHLRLRE
jgi:hypothetical protein